MGLHVGESIWFSQRVLLDALDTFQKGLLFSSMVAEYPNLVSCGCWRGQSAAHHWLFEPFRVPVTVEIETI